MRVHEEVKPGRGSASLVQGEVDGYDELNVTRGKGKGGKGEHGNKGGIGGKGFQRSVEMKKGEEKHEGVKEDERVAVTPNMEAGGSHHQATFDQEEAEEDEQETEEEQQRKEGQCSEPGQWVENCGASRAPS